ncbi:MAG: hypothetical protein ACI9WC_000129 [Arenicella sp.]|jgi:hypothetical protein
MNINHPSVRDVSGETFGATIYANGVEVKKSNDHFFRNKLMETLLVIVKKSVNYMKSRLLLFLVSEIAMPLELKV